MEYGTDGTLYGEFGVVMNFSSNDDVIAASMKMLMNQACEALDFLDERLNDYYKPGCLPEPNGDIYVPFFPELYSNEKLTRLSEII